MNLERLKVIKDNRGSLIEAFHLPNDGRVFYVIANPNQTRGNHYHKVETEHFLVIYGSATMRVRDRVTDEVMKVEVSGYKPMVISVYPNHTHSITATDEGAIFLVWSDKLYDKNKADTYPEEV